jgi:hypothetical protein
MLSERERERKRERERERERDVLGAARCALFTVCVSLTARVCVS